MPALLCTVRGCALPLNREGRSLRCERGHAFDLARSGYVNLLGPQDRRSRNPGDSASSVDSRRRLFDRGLGARLSEDLAELIAPYITGPANTLLDVGCGEGTHLGRLAERFRCEASGLDLSVRAIDFAARRYPEIQWVVANADRWLPYSEKSFDVILSITSRRNAAEFQRILRSDGRVVVVVPAPDDLIELRQAVLGAGVERSRVESLVEELGTDLEVDRIVSSRERRFVSREEVADLLASTYRGARRSQSEAAGALTGMECTFAYDIVLLKN